MRYDRRGLLRWRSLVWVVIWIGSRVHRVAAVRWGRVGRRVDYLVRLRRRWMVRVVGVGGVRRWCILQWHVSGRPHRRWLDMMRRDWLAIGALHVDDVCRERLQVRRRRVGHELRRRRRLVLCGVLHVSGGMKARIVGALLRLVRLVIALLLLAFLLPLLAKVVLVREDLCARREWSGEAEKV